MEVQGVIKILQLLDFALTSRLHLTRNPITAVNKIFTATLIYIAWVDNET
jgi:hypothetical protein